MSMNELDAINLAFDKIFAPHERARAIQRPRNWGEQDDRVQREGINRYWEQSTYQRGLLGEAMNEHKLYTAIRAAFVAGDTAELGRLADIAIRDYICPVMDGDEFT